MSLKVSWARGSGVGKRVDKEGLVTWDDDSYKMRLCLSLALCCDHTGKCVCTEGPFFAHVGAVPWAVSPYSTFRRVCRVMEHDERFMEHRQAFRGVLWRVVLLPLILHELTHEEILYWKSLTLFPHRRWCSLAFHGERERAGDYLMWPCCEALRAKTSPGSGTHTVMYAIC